MAKVGLREWLAIGRVIASGRLARYGGPGEGPLDRFEKAFSQQFDIRHVLTVSSGTGALISGLSASGVGPGDEVLVPAYTWIATAAAVLAVGAVPVIVDIDETLTMDPDDIERRITPRTRAILPVHMANMVCDMEAIMALARKHGLLVIEDACQAVGVTYRDRRVGTIGDIGAFSFNQFKNINIGEGGAVASQSDRFFARARMYHDVGELFRGHLDNYNEPSFFGVNFKASQIQGAMLNVQLAKLDPMLKRMRQRHQVMARILSGCDAFRLGPHNDPQNAVGLHLLFETEEEAKTFAAKHRRGVYRVFDSSRHVCTHWTPILEKRAFHPAMNPYGWAKASVDYGPDMCARSLDILKRTCRISLGENYPTALMAYLARRMAGQSSQERRLSYAS
ncbi:aminotransferase class I/II-fold pyridoxal phosphate-dependent enzyme [Nitratireductor aquimarinus]|uniref:DegT/DnrJ/EryC1/StrS family aminotransferase n=1 Tax=Nitratireductor aquimarinus TaxID=889300 RepID=UPI00293674DC|nr:aminotransferase class I/II-fold pyridoxal phosphate-dependent enzyme [Nitratireductor aquimarinus]MDV2968184.1 aminotransferase class I/II-fold pyridoxal phosphate-dependent enzyme [Nitratireductor aquimarinus]